MTAFGSKIVHSTTLLRRSVQCKVSNAIKEFRRNDSGFSRPILFFFSLFFCGEHSKDDSTMAEFTCLTYRSASTLMDDSSINFWTWLSFMPNFCHFSKCSALETLQNFEKSSTILKIWQKMKKNFAQKITDESSIK